MPWSQQGNAAGGNQDLHQKGCGAMCFLWSAGGSCREIQITVPSAIVPFLTITTMPLRM